VSQDCGTWRDDITVPMITACDSFISCEAGNVLVQAAKEAAVKKTQTNPVATRFNLPRFLLDVLLV
jgi:hypothetical protein